MNVRIKGYEGAIIELIARTSDVVEFKSHKPRRTDIEFYKVTLYTAPGIMVTIDGVAPEEIEVITP